jgi:hypothetical protein
MRGRIREERIGFPACLEELIWVSQQLAILHTPNDVNIYIYNINIYNDIVAKILKP